MIIDDHILIYSLVDFLMIIHTLLECEFNNYIYDISHLPQDE